MQSQKIVQVTGLCKTYGGITALKSVDFELDAGEIHGLCGENGAGKSTLVKILGGLVEPTEGQILFDGSALRLGRRTDPSFISIVHQELSIIPALTVLDNVLMGNTRVGRIYFRGRFKNDVRRQLDAVGLPHIALDQSASELSLAERQLVEIARCVLHGAKVLILDEPTATLAETEIARVFTAVRWLRDQGKTVVFISHRLNEVFDLTDRITVFRSGERILTAPTSEMSTDSLVFAMVGHEVERRTTLGAINPHAHLTRLKLDGFGVPDACQPLDLEVPAGEILGVVGQLGSGADRLIEAIAGVRAHTGGLSIDGQQVDIQSPQKAISQGIAYVPEDRAGKGVFLEASIGQNSTASILAQLTRFGRLETSRERDAAQDLMKRFTIDTRRIGSKVSSLSGGNQQKVAMAKAAAIAPKILVLNEPTRGVDIGARAEIYVQLRSMAASGLTVIFFSTDFEEVLELADRVITVFRGKPVNDQAIDQCSMTTILMDILHGHGEEKIA
ncbi:ABC-type sugar transport system ATPase subunit [Pseudomonas hunanensis]|uniref:ABC-type sugar transport system ATPase subunit n=1 Tax=Pseudomonas hunanensis TaxID=1247546 RepID=A0ACC6JY31_9PSED|nr:sugar ABC transporter ATP-binding protein [Pseudomonas hunanensis]MDR6711094.1 ABC-type sugar transport system ATPase subunit [Pseudomonas hunanensis]